MKFSPKSEAILHWTHLGIVQNMLDYDFLCGREPSVRAVFSSQKTGKKYKIFFWDKEIFIPTIHSRDEVDQFPNVDTLINLASFRSCTAVNKSAIESGKFEHVFTIAEWVAERETRELITLAKESKTDFFWPAIVGAMLSGVFRIGHTWWSLDNILASWLCQPGSVGIVTKSWGMMNELCRIVSKNSDGVHSAFQVGWDRFPMMSFLPLLEYLEEHEEIKIIVLLGEVGNRIEIEIADMIAAGKITKPVVAWCIWTSAEKLKTEVQFWHAWAKANSDEEKASYKNAYLKNVWAHVPESFDDFWKLIAQVSFELWLKKEDGVSEEIKSRCEVLKRRRKTNFSSSISDERWDELLYNGIKISDFVSQGSLMKVIGHLWLKKELPDYACKFLETIFILLADHGPAVSWATNTIVTARAGKDVVSSLISWLATIGPRFWGAVTWAGKWLLDATQRGLSPQELVNEMKAKGVYIQWIWHKVKSIYNPDKRCELMKELAENFPTRNYLDFALQVEELTTQKKPNLILNVDGHIAAMMLDALTDMWYTYEEMNSLIKADFLNALFVMARSVWFIGHYLDQQRLNEGLYRTPWNDILYLEE